MSSSLRYACTLKMMLAAMMPTIVKMKSLVLHTWNREKSERKAQQGEAGKKTRACDTQPSNQAGLGDATSDEQTTHKPLTLSTVELGSSGFLQYALKPSVSAKNSTSSSALKQTLKK